MGDPGFLYLKNQLSELLCENVERKLKRKVVICMTFGTPEGRHVAKGRKDFEKFIFLNQYGSRWSHNE
jgi:hypothetical protein